MAFLSVSYASTLALSAILLAIIVLRATCARFTKTYKRRYPPGPLAIPVLGNVHQLPADYQQRKLAFNIWVLLR